MTMECRTAKLGAGRRRSQRGELLIESVASLMVLSLVVVAGLVGMLTIVRASATHQGKVRTSNESTIAAEYVDRIAYRPCAKAGGVSTPKASTYQSDMGTGASPYVSPDGLTTLLTVQEVQYLASSTSATASFVADCPAAGDQGAQRLTVKVTAQTTTGTVSSRMVFIKRNDSCDGLSEAVEGQTC